MGTLLGYFVIGFVIIVATTILYLPFFFILKKRVTILRQLFFLLLVGCILTVLFATIFIRLSGNVFSPHQYHLNLIPFQWITKTWQMSNEKKIMQVVANMVMFIPLGFLVPIVFPKIRSFIKTVLILSLFSFSIELFQYFIGEVADVDDLIQNLLGSAFGYTIFSFINHCVRSNKQKQRMKLME